MKKLLLNRIKSFGDDFRVFGAIQISRNFRAERTLVKSSLENIKDARLGAIYDSQDYNKHFPSMDLYIPLLSIGTAFSPVRLLRGAFLALRGRRSFVIRESLIGDHPSV